MKIFYSAYLSEANKNSDQARFTLEGIPSLLSRHVTDHDKLICYFETEGGHRTSANTQNILSDLRSADAFVGEMSLASNTLGFELAYANLHFIPSLYLHRDASPVAPDSLITNSPSRKLWVKAYDEHNASRVIAQFMKMVERQMETARTSFMSTREVDEYLSNASDSLGMPKGEIIRQVLGEAARKENEQNNV